MLIAGSNFCCTLWVWSDRPLLWARIPTRAQVSGMTKCTHSQCVSVDSITVPCAEDVLQPSKVIRQEVRRNCRDLSY